ncbi:MAG: hypothetical protein Q8N10_03630 [Phenylobacterium sp.]|uniref:hypothetical protein n=1 Tax=Phenylobacterium sp. TaxID=1871053 RepID=UPI0027288EA2|nr:hypothetical protein [Phenylobacterium sp.]MDO8912360.1 hypothetical protein [Phenylobacterium sp.]MDP3099572.1 hypothetical protein [Phenylobacterium sp.]
MRKTPLILAGAIAFDLGVMVVSGHAAEVVKGPQPAAAAKTSQDFHIKMEKAGANLNFTKFKVEYPKIDNVDTRRACTVGGGQVVLKDGAAQCQTPVKAGPGGR